MLNSKPDLGYNTIPLIYIEFHPNILFNKLQHQFDNMDEFCLYIKNKKDCSDLFYMLYNNKWKHILQSHSNLEDLPQR